MMDNFGNSRSRQRGSVQIPRRGCRQDDRQIRRKVTQRRREIEGESDSGLVADERRVEARSHSTGLRGLMQPGEADRLITESCENLLIPQQASAVGFKHQHGFANTAIGDAGRMLNGYRLIAWDGWKPDVEPRSSSKGALNLHSSVVLPDDVTNCCEPETIAVGTRGKEWLENPLQRCLVHTPPGIGNRNHNEATGADPDLANPQRLHYFAQPNLNLNDAWFIHGLDSIVADIQDDLLQLSRFRRYCRRFGSLAYGDPGMGR